MSSALLKSLEGMMASSEAADYEKTGFHHRHRAASGQICDIASAFLKAGYLLEMMTCEDRREDAQAMRLCYSYNSLSSVDRHMVQVDIAGSGDPKDLSYEAPTLCEIYGGANWFEREVFEMYGVIFEGHPYLERLLLPEDVTFFALRRDFGRIEDAEEESAE